MPKTSKSCRKCGMPDFATGLCDDHHKCINCCNNSKCASLFLSDQFKPLNPTMPNTCFPGKCDKCNKGGFKCLEHGLCEKCCKKENFYDSHRCCRKRSCCGNLTFDCIHGTCILCCPDVTCIQVKILANKNATTPQNVFVCSSCGKKFVDKSLVSCKHNRHKYCCMICIKQNQSAGYYGGSYTTNSSGPIIPPPVNPVTKGFNTINLNVNNMPLTVEELELKKLNDNLKGRLQFFDRAPTNTNCLLAIAIMEEIILRYSKKILMEDKKVILFEKCKNQTTGAKTVGERQAALNATLRIMEKLIKVEEKEKI